MVTKITNKVRRLNSLKLWSAITGVALVVALVLTFLPMLVSVNTGGLLSISLQQTQASPSFTPRTETYVDFAGLSSPYSITVTKPTGTADGDILFCWLSFYNGTGTVIDSVPDGWVLVGEELSSTLRFALYYKIAASEGASWDWSFAANVAVRAVCSCYTGGDFDPADPIDVVSNTVYKTSDTACKAASMTVAAANSPLVFWGGVRTFASSTFTKPSVPTSDWIEDDDAGSTTSDAWTEVCSMVWAGSGATGDMIATISVSTAAKHAFAVALNPPSVVVPTVTTQAATNIYCTNFTANGNITATGGANAHTRGFCYMVGSSGDPTTANSTVFDNGGGSYGTGTYSKAVTSLSASTGYRVRAYAINSAGTGYGATVQVTTADYIGAGVSPTSYNFTIVAASSTPYTTTSYFTLTNNSSVQTDQTISVTTSTWSGGVGWTHSNNCTASADTAGLKTNVEGTWGTGDIIIKYSSPNYIYDNCPAYTNYNFGLKLWAPTSMSDGIEKSIIVIIDVVAS